MTRRSVFMTRAGVRWGRRRLRSPSSERWGSAGTGKARGRLARGGAGEHGRDDPLVAASPGGVAAAGAGRVAVAGLAVGEPAGMAVDGVIADRGHGPIG